MAKVTRLSINISEQTADALKSLAERHDTSVTNIVRRAVGIYDFLDKELGEQRDRSLQIVDKEKKEVTTIAIV